MKKIITVLIILISFSTFGQRVKSSQQDNKYLIGKSFFGVHISPIVPTSILLKNNYTHTTDSVSYSITNLPSISYGAEIRHYFTYRFALISGITYTKRNIKIDYNSSYPTDSRKTDTSFTGTLHFIAFEIPIQAVGYVRLTRKIYMDIAGGINLNFYPSHLRIDHIVMQRIGTGGIQFFQLGYNINLGWEYRTEESGFFYIGCSIQYRFDYMANILLYEKETRHTADYHQSIYGNYFAFNIKYIFPLGEKR